MKETTIIQVPENMQVQYIYAPATSLDCATLRSGRAGVSVANSANFVVCNKTTDIKSDFLPLVPKFIEGCSGYALTFELSQYAQLELDLDLTNYSNNLELTFKFNLNGPGASIKLISRAILRDQQEIKIITEQNHLAPDTTSDLLLKTVCFDQAKWSYNGKILVSPAGHRTVASQVNHNLLMPSYSQAISIPALEVLTNDVKCTHGSAVGQVDRDSLYYLMARGLT